MKGNCILWLSNDTKFLDNTISLLERNCLTVEGVKNLKNCIDKIKKNYFKYSLVILDIEISEMEFIKISLEIKKINSQIPIVNVKALLHDLDLNTKIKALHERAVERPLPKKIRNEFKKLFMLIKLKQENGIRKRINPFKYSYDTFMKLTGEEIGRLFDVASEVNSAYVKKFFKENSNKDWIVIVKKPGNIVASGKSTDEPFEDDLIELAIKYKAPVFTYSRPKIIEHMDLYWKSESQFCILNSH